MLTDDKRIRVITGHYGSGKTEFAVNYALNLVLKTKRKVALADLDIVNLYFRSREKRKMLEDRGIRVIYSSLVDDMTDLPALSPDMLAPLEDKAYDYIIDLGGNDIGTNVLGRLKPKFNSEELDFFMAVNTNRPDTSGLNGIIEQKEEIEKASGIKITGFINTTNMIWETSADTLVSGHEIIKLASEKTGVGIRYTAYIENFIPKEDIPRLKALGPELMPMKLYMREAWM